MHVPFRMHFVAAPFVFALCTVISIPPTVSTAQDDSRHQADVVDPWLKTEILQATDLANELRAAKNENAPTIVYVGFHTLFAGGHIPGASFHGSASTEKGLAELKTWLATLPRSAHVVIYCGCCPFDRCPNIRPAYKALHDLGFANIRVLVLPTSFAADWVEKGYPMRKGSDHDSLDGALKR